MTIAIGRKLDRYEIRSKIGAGEMGEICLVQDMKLDRKIISIVF